MTSQTCIAIEESLQFARLSGDYNPLHVDPIRARRLPFSGTVVHGISVVMRALDTAFAAHGGGSLKSLTAQFESPVATSQPFTVETAREGDEIAIRIRTSKGIAQKITASLASQPPEGPVTIALDPRYEPRELDLDAASQASGSLPFMWDSAIAAALYPRLAAAAPAWQLAGLAATTRIVGMECPGLHSVYASLTMDFTRGHGPLDAVTWRVTTTDKRFRLLRIEMEASTLSARIDALVRPAPVVQPSYADVRAAAPSGRFRGRRALVIGGSRGLGEVAAKILAAGSADVAISYATGAQDAGALVEDIVSGGGLARALAFDVLSPPLSRPNELSDEWIPTDLFYFASPQIVLAPGAPWNEQQFRRFCNYFVTGFAGAVTFCDHVLGTAAKDLRIFYPSTVYVTEPPPGGAEYAASKGAAEGYCAFLKLRRPKTVVDAPRLPRMLTDQTSSVRSGPMEQPLGVLLRSIT